MNRSELGFFSIFQILSSTMLTLNKFIFFFDLEFAGLLIGFYTLVSSAVAFAFLTGLEVSMLFFDPCHLIEDFGENAWAVRQFCSVAMLAIVIMVFLISLAFLFSAIVGWWCVTGIGQKNASLLEPMKFLLAAQAFWSLTELPDSLSTDTISCLVNAFAYFYLYVIIHSLSVKLAK